MYIKFLKHGKGDPAKAASYLIDDVDHLNVPRSDVQVLRGDPQTFTALAESITNKWLYTSGVIAWAKSDNPSDAEINEVLDSFESHAFSGLQPNQYHFTAVLHQEDDGSKHVHFLVPRLEIETGKALNIAPPGHEKYFDPLRDYFNYSKNWSRPDDPALQQNSQVPDYVHYQDKSAIKAGLKDKTRTEINEFIGSMIEQRIMGGYINDRADVLNAILDYGRITRISDKYIAFQPNESEKITRLKGAFYDPEFSIESYRKVRSRSEIDATASSEYRTISAEHREHAERCRTELIQLAEKRSTYNRNRYTAGITSTAELELSQVIEQQLNQLDRETDSRNSYAFESTSTAAATPDSAVSADQRAVTAVERYEPSNWRDSQDQESPFHINYGFSFDSSYSAYIEHLARLRQQEQIQRHQRDAEQSRVSEIQRGEHDNNNVRGEIVRGARPELSRQKLQLRKWGTTFRHSERGTLNENRSPIIEDYRRTTESIEATTANARRSLAPYTGAISDNKRVEAVHENFKREAQRSSQDRAEISADNARTVRANCLSDIFSSCAREAAETIAESFTAINQQLEHRSASQSTDSAYSAEFSATRDRETDRANSGRNDRTNALGRTLSTKTSSIDPANIFKALEKIEKTREMRREQERKNDTGYDSPSPF